MFWTVVGRGMAWGLFLIFLCFGIAIVVSLPYSTIKGWGERPWWANTVRVGGAVVGVIVGLSIVLIVLEVSVGLLH